MRAWRGVNAAFSCLYKPTGALAYFLCLTPHGQNISSVHSCMEGVLLTLGGFGLHTVSVLLLA